MKNENESKKFHILINNKVTGEVIVDTDTNCVVAGFKTNEGSSQLILAECNTMDLVTGIIAAEGAVEAAKKKTLGNIFSSVVADTKECDDK